MAVKAKKRARPKAAPRKAHAPELGCGHCGSNFTEKQLAKHLADRPCGQWLAEVADQRLRQFDQYVPLDKPTKGQQRAREAAGVHQTVDARTCLELRRSDATVTFIPYTLAGLGVERLPVAEFQKQYRPLPDYPTARCAKLYLGAAQQMGATDEALTELQGLVTALPVEVQTAQARLQANKATRQTVKTVHAGKHGHVKLKTKQTVKGSAAQMFRGLIMEGKLTDDEIFRRVQEVYGLPDKRRPYVGYYRNELRKKGHEPPPPVKHAKPTAKKTAKKKTKKVTKKTTKKRSRARGKRTQQRG